MKYRSKPIIKEAIKHLDKHSFNEMVLAWGDDFRIKGSFLVMQNLIRIKTLEGDMYSSPGDYIVKGIKGEFYPVKPNIFEKSYEKVEE